jgi:Domain of unknown function (DUF397)
VKPKCIACASNPDLRWVKSSYSGDNGNCVEVAFSSGTVSLRDSKDPEGSALVFTTAEWQAFVHGVRDGDFGL